MSNNKPIDLGQMEDIIRHVQLLLAGKTLKPQQAEIISDAVNTALARATKPTGHDFQLTLHTLKVIRPTTRRRY